MSFFYYFKDCVMVFQVLMSSYIAIRDVHYFCLVHCAFW